MIVFYTVTHIRAPGRNDLTRNFTDGPSDLTSGSLTRFARAKEEQIRNPRDRAVSGSTDTSKSKSLTQDHNYTEFLPDSVDPLEAGACQKLTLMQTSVQLAKDAVGPSKATQKSIKNTIDLRGYDVHELKRVYTLSLSAIRSLKNMAQNAPSAASDASKMLKLVPDVVRSFTDMRDFSALSH